MHINHTATPPLQVALVRQAEDRAHRKGAVRPINVYFLCAKGTWDEQRCAGRVYGLHAM